MKKLKIPPNAFKTYFRCAGFGPRLLLIKVRYLCTVPHIANIDVIWSTFKLNFEWLHHEHLSFMKDLESRELSRIRQKLSGIVRNRICNPDYGIITYDVDHTVLWAG